MISQIVTIGGAWGTAARAADGVLALVASGFGWWAAHRAWASVRPWWAAWATVWGLLGVMMILGAFDCIIRSEWVPWITHGLLIVNSGIMVGWSIVSVQAHRHVTEALLTAIDGDA